MASSTLIHSKMGIVDATGNVSQFCPSTSGIDVILKPNGFGSGSTVQELVDNLGEVAFDQNFLGIDDEAIEADDTTWSTNKLSSYLDEAKHECDALTEAFNNGCVLISEKLTERGVPTNTTNPNTIAANIRTLAAKAYNEGYNKGTVDSKVGDATKADVLFGKFFTNADSIGLKGTMTDNPVIERTLNPGETVSYSGKLKRDTVIKTKSIKKIRLDRVFTITNADQNLEEVYTLPSEEILSYAIVSYSCNALYAHVPKIDEGESPVIVNAFNNITLNIVKNGNNLYISYHLGGHDLASANNISIGFEIVYI